MTTPLGDRQIGWHNDAQKTRAGIPVDMYPDSPVLSVSFGSDMVFWVKRVLEGKGKFGPETAAVVLRHGGVWCWRAPNRARTAHSTAPPTPHPSAAAGPRSPPTPTHPHCGVLPVPGDDARFQHHVCFPRQHEEGYNPEGVRFTIVLRWCRGVREYDPYTHRNKTGAAVANPEEFTL